MAQKALKALCEAVIVSYGRAPIARASKGALRDEHPVDYAAQVLTGVLERVPELKTEWIEDLIVGCAKPEGVQGGNIARLIAQRAGLPDSVAGQTVNRFCASGLQAIATAANAIIAGQAEIICAGGVESMTAIPMGSPLETRNPWLSEHKPEVYLPMGITAENVAEKYRVSREEMEQLAIDSHRKAAAAQASGAFNSQLIPVSGKDAEGNVITLKTDEGVRPSTSAEKLASLAPCFKEDGIVTAATSSQTSDSAAFVVLMTAEKAKKLGLTPVAKFVSYAVAGVPADIMGTGPIEAVPKALELAGLSMAVMDVIEINEAFAAQAIPCIKTLGMDKEKVNPNGGAMALGHPLGATGAILTCKALTHLQRIGGKYALVTMCIGGGMGAAGVFEML